MPDQMPTVSVVIPAYNRRDSILKLLADVYQQEGTSFEVIVVDDCSSDDTVATIAAAYPQTQVLRNEKNGGPAVSRNRGVLAAKGEFIVGFDSDVTVPDRQVLKRTVEHFRQRPDVTGLAFHLLEPDGKTEDTPRWWHPVPIAKFAQSYFETHYFSGTGYAFRRNAMVEAGLYPEWLYMHYEEVVLAYRILDQGGILLYCPDLPVLHHASPIAARSKIKTFYKPRNQILVAVACYSWPRALIYILPRLIFNASTALRHAHYSDFHAALYSAIDLVKVVRRNRRIITNATWSKIAKLAHQSPCRNNPRNTTQ